MEGDEELRDLYREVLLDYSRDGSHKGRVESPDYEARGLNPVCGDEVEITVSARNGKIGQIRCSGHGCVISQASSAMMAESLEGVTIERAADLVEAFKRIFIDDKRPELPAELEAADSLEGVRKYPARVKCATLAWNTLKLALTGASRGKVEYQEK